MVERIQETLVQRIWSSLHCIDWSDPVKSWNAGPSATFCWEAKRRCFTQLLGPHMSKNKLIKSECKTLKLLCVLDMEKHHINHLPPPLARQLMGFGDSALRWHLTLDIMNQLCEECWSRRFGAKKHHFVFRQIWMCLKLLLHAPSLHWCIHERLGAQHGWIANVHELIDFFFALNKLTQTLVPKLTWKCSSQMWIRSQPVSNCSTTRSTNLHIANAALV